MSRDECFDVIVIGAGPAGATASLVLARAGVRVVIVEKQSFPRFQIGESLLPASYDLMRRLGLADKLRTVPHMPKYGAEFAMANETEGSFFEFGRCLAGDGENRTLNIARADFDEVLLREARHAGAAVRMPQTVRSIERLADGDVRIRIDEGDLRARWLLDGSGQATVLGRHLGTRLSIQEPHLRKVAYFEHYRGVERHPGRRAGFPAVGICDEGWFWCIPLNDDVTSLGLVLDRDAARSIDVPASRMLAWGLDRCPFFHDRLRNATGPMTNRVCSDFSYSCAPYSGPGYFLLGDAATFFDPVFATGVSLGMESAVRAAGHVIAILNGDESAHSTRQAYNPFLHRSTQTFLRVIRGFYDHSFRELFLHGHGPLDVERGLLTVLGGYIYPRLPFRASWRFAAFSVLMRIQDHWALVPRRDRFSLMNAPVTGNSDAA